MLFRSAAEEDHHYGFEPEQEWGKIGQGWTMPRFQSEPSDARTWTAGKLVAEIPPVAGRKELPLTQVQVELDSLDQTRWDGTLLEGAAPSALRHAIPETAWTAHFSLAENKLTTAQPVEVPSGLRAQASTFEWYKISGAQFTARPLIQDLILDQNALAGSARVSQLPTGKIHRSSRKTKALQAEALSATQQPSGLEPREPALPHPDGWSWTQTITAPKVGMPEIAPARMETAKAVGAPAWETLANPAENPAENPVAHWSHARLSSIGVSFGWESATVQTGPVEPVGAAQQDYPVPAPRPLDLRAQAGSGLLAVGPCLWRSWPVQEMRAEFAVGPMLSTAELGDWSVVVPFDARKLTPKQQLDRKSTRLNSSHIPLSRMPSSA